MQYLLELLQIPNSQLAELLKFNLHGLQAALHQARRQLNQDPGCDLCDKLIQEITEILEVPKLQIIGLPREELKLTQLRQAFNSDGDLRLYLGDEPLRGKTDADLWAEIHHKLLRVPENLATVWRRRALELAQLVGARVDNVYLRQLPFMRDELIYPGLGGTIQAQGLCLSPGHIYEGGDVDVLTAIVELLINFMALEPDLHHAFKSLYRFGVVGLHDRPEQYKQYVATLRDRLARTQKAEEGQDCLSILRAWIEVDEAINSLVFVPPVARSSWWGKLQQESRRILGKKAQKAIDAGYELRIRQLSGLYADVCGFSTNDLQVDEGGVPGEVLSCLRVYAKIGQQELRGRVIFRSL